MEDKLLTACLIVKNEEAVIRRALESVKEADEIVIVDTGSVDKTVEIAKEYGKVYRFEWCDDFSAARNYAISKCKTDWALTIDADMYLEPGGIKKIKESLIDMGEYDALNLKSTWMDTNIYHKHILVYRKENRYIGKIHEYVVGNAKNTDIVMHYDKSPSHDFDPDRNLRILKEAVKDGKAREMFYLAGEYYDRKDFKKALTWFKRYIKVGDWRYEIADANLRIAKCLWNLNRGDEARNYCLQAIMGNPEFKEALLLMAEMSWDKEKKTWLKYAELATNEDVLFVR